MNTRLDDIERRLSALEKPQDPFTYKPSAPLSAGMSYEEKIKASLPSTNDDECKSCHSITADGRPIENPCPICRHIKNDDEKIDLTEPILLLKEMEYQLRLGYTHPITVLPDGCDIHINFQKAIDILSKHNRGDK